MNSLKPFVTRMFMYCAFVWIAAPAASIAQPLSIILDELDASRFPEIRMVVRVFDGGSAVQGLTIDNFTVRENGQIQAPIQGGCFDSLFFSPSSIMLILDRSGSMDTAFPVLRQAAKDFIIRSSDEDEFAIFSFGGSGRNGATPDIDIVSGWSQNKANLIAAIDGIPTPYGGTFLRRTIIFASDWFADRTKKRIMVVLADGRESADIYSSNQAINAAKANKITVYTIGLGSEIDQAELRNLATQTGGKFYLAPTVGELAGIYQDISSELAPTGNCEFTYTCLLDCYDGSTVDVEIQVHSGNQTASASASFDLPYDTTTFTYVGISANRNYVVEAGDEMVFPITLNRVSTNRTSNNYEIDVAFDKSLIELIDVQPTALTAGYATGFDETATGATVTLSGGSAIADTGEIALLVYRAFPSLESDKSEIGIGTPRTGTTCTIASSSNGLITINGFCHRTLFAVEGSRPETSILPNSPNPFNPGTTVSYTIGKDGVTTLKVHNALGREVATLFDGYRTAGAYQMYFDATGLPNGVYYLHLENNDDVAMRRVVMLK